MYKQLIEIIQTTLECNELMAIYHLANVSKELNELKLKESAPLAKQIVVGNNIPVEYTELVIRAAKLVLVYEASSTRATIPVTVPLIELLEFDHVMRGLKVFAQCDTYLAEI